MATYYIPSDITGGTILVNPGDVFIFEGNATDDVKFESASGSPTSFSIEFNASNTNLGKVDIKENLNADISIADNVNLNGVAINAATSLSTNVDIGDNVTLDKFDGSNNGSDTVVIGDNFTTNNDFRTNAGDDSVRVGENFGGGNAIDTGNGDDTVATYDRGANIQNAETVQEPDGLVTGGAGNDSMGPGYSDGQADEIDGVDGDADTIYGLGGADTINAGDGADIVYGDRAAPPPDPDPAAEQLAFDIGNADIDGGGRAIFDISKEGDKSLANDVTITDAGTEAITRLEVRQLGDDDGEVDVIRVDLSTFDDDFEIVLFNERPEDIIYLIGVQSETDNNDGTFTYTYIGSDDLLHTVTADPSAATVMGYFAGDPAGGDDVIDGGAGDDTLYGDGGSDSLTGGTGADVLDGGEGDDTLEGGAGADSIVGGTGSDSIDGGTEADTIDGGAGDDVIEGGAGNDSLSGGEADPGDVGRLSFNWSDVPDPHNGGQIDNNDTLVGTGTQTVGGVDVDYTITGNVSYSPGGENGAGNVYSGGIDAGSGSVNEYSAASFDDSGTMEFTFSQAVENVQFRINDLESSGSTVEIRVYDADDNLIPFTSTDGSVVTGSDTDAIAGNDTFTGTDASAGDNSAAGSIFVSAPGPVARISIDYVTTSNDSLTMTDVFFDDPTPPSGDGGNDTLIGGAGDDIIDGNDGDDSLTGGDGDDTFVYAPGDGNDTITDFNTGNSGALRDDDTTNNDFIDLGQFYDDISELREDFDDDGVLNQSNATTNGGTVDYSDNTQFGASDSLTIQGAGTNDLTTDNTGVDCFTTGTAILTPKGDVLIDDLRVGDLVCTVDNGPQPIAWIGKREVTNAELSAHPSLRPIRINKDVLGAARNIFVSRQHGMLINDGNLARAIHLADYHPGIRIAKGKKTVTYIHLMFDAHQIVIADNIPSESFFPGPQGLRMMGSQDFKRLLLSFPKLENVDSLEAATEHYGPLARPFLKRKEVQKLCDGMRKQSQPAADELKKWDRDLAMERSVSQSMLEAHPNKQTDKGRSQAA